MTHKLILMQKKNIMYHILVILFISMELPNWMEWKTTKSIRAIKNIVLFCLFLKLISMFVW